MSKEKASQEHTANHHAPQGFQILTALQAELSINI